MSAADDLPPITGVVHDGSLTGDGTAAAPLAVPAGTAAAGQAVAASPGEVILLITTTGSQIVITDIPVVAWLTDETGAMPVIPWTLTAQWARIEIETKHLSPGLIGGAVISATMYDDSFRGGFPEFLDYIIAVTGLGITGSALLDGNLISAFGSWAAGKHGGRRFAPA